jgi:hypothetical protein
VFSTVVSRIPNDPVILSIIHHRQNPLEYARSFERDLKLLSVKTYKQDREGMILAHHKIYCNGTSYSEDFLASWPR